MRAGGFQRNLSLNHINRQICRQQQAAETACQACCRYTVYTCTREYEYSSTGTWYSCIDNNCQSADKLIDCSVLINQKRKKVLVYTIWCNLVLCFFRHFYNNFIICGIPLGGADTQVPDQRATLGNLCVLWCVCVASWLPAVLADSSSPRTSSRVCLALRSYSGTSYTCTMYVCMVRPGCVVLRPQACSDSREADEWGEGCRRRLLAATVRAAQLLRGARSDSK